MDIFRIEKLDYIETLLFGIPGERFDFRWNTKGHPIIYASESRSLALHENSVNISKPFYGIPSHFRIVKMTIPDDDYDKVKVQDLPKSWNRIDLYHSITQQIGDTFTRAKKLAIFVPSTIVNDEYNILLNPIIALKTDIQMITERIDERILDRHKIHL